MELKELVGKKILDEVIKYKDPNIIYPTTGKRRMEWKILIVDNFSMRIISSCCKVHDLCDEGVTLIEHIHKDRQAFPSMDAIYLLTPNVESVQGLINDFENKHDPKYKGAFVFFTEEIPDDIFEMLKKFPVRRYMKACREIDISFLPHEKQVFSLDSRDTFKSIYSPDFSPSRPASLERMAEQIATLCATLDEFPSVRYRKEGLNNEELAQLVEKKLNMYKKNHPSMGDTPAKGCSQLLILDRGFDCISPLLHELTLQAMAYDLLPIENDIYKYSVSNHVKEVLLDENDDLWVELRYKHIAEVSADVTKKLKDFIQTKNIMKSSEGTKTIKDLSQMIKQMPQYQKELSKYGKHLNLVEDCVKAYEGKIDKLCSVEQDLVMGYDGDGEIIKDHFKNIVPLFLDETVSKFDKIRLIALFVMIKNGISRENLTKLLTHAQLEGEEQIIQSFKHLGVNVIENSGRTNNDYPRRERENEEKLRLSRWTPIIKDILEDCLEDKLDENKFPFVLKRPNFDNKTFRSAGATSARQYGQWRDVKGGNKTTSTKDSPRIICFIVGGVSMSETRTAYELKDNKQNHNITIGSSQILTPEEFLNNLSTLS